MSEPNGTQHSNKGEHAAGVVALQLLKTTEALGARMDRIERDLATLLRLLTCQAQTLDTLELRGLPVLARRVQALQVAASVLGPAEGASSLLAPLQPTAPTQPAPRVALRLVTP